VLSGRNYGALFNIRSHRFTRQERLKSAGSFSGSDPSASGNSDNSGRWVQKTSLIQPISNPVELV